MVVNIIVVLCLCLSRVTPKLLELLFTDVCTWVKTHHRFLTPKAVQLFLFLSLKFFFFFFFFFFLIINRKVPVFKTKLALCQTQKNETQRSPRLICSEKSIVGEFLHTSAP